MRSVESFSHEGSRKPLVETGSWLPLGAEPYLNVGRREGIVTSRAFCAYTGSYAGIWVTP